MRSLLRLLAVLIVVEAVLFAARRIGRLLSASRTNPPLRSSAGGHLVKDPVCGTYIPSETAIQERNQFFCSEQCRAKYLAG